MKPSSASTQEPFATRFGQPEIIPTVIYSRQISVNISPDGQAATALFEGGMDVELQTDDKNGSATTVAVLQIPVILPDTLSETFLGHYVRLDGFIDKTEGTQASLLVDIGADAKTVDFQPGKGLHENFVVNVFGFGNNKPLPPSPHITVVIVLTVRRLVASDTCLLRIDSLTVEINKLQRVLSNDATNPQ